MTSNMEPEKYEAPLKDSLPIDEKGYMELYPNSDKKTKPKRKTKWKFIVAALMIIAVFLSIFLCGYWLRYKKHADQIKLLPTKKPCIQYYKAELEGDTVRELEILHKSLMISMSGGRIVNLLRNFTKLSIYSTSTSDQILTHVVETFFKEAGLSTFQSDEFSSHFPALLSFPERYDPNLVIILDAKYNFLRVEPSEQELKALQELAKNISGPNGEMPTFNKTELQNRAQELEKKQKENYIPGVLPSPEQWEALKAKQSKSPTFDFDTSLLSAEAHLPFATYSAKGIAMGDLVYFHYGTKENFIYAKQAQVSLKGNIALIRIGNGSLREKIRVAELFGLAGVVLYDDPQDAITSESCPNKAPFVNLNDENIGDISTPNFPSQDIDEIFVESNEMKEKKSPLTKIPVQTISCQLAYALMRNMTGIEAPAAWFGAFNVTYYIGARDFSGFASMAASFLSKSPPKVRIHLNSSMVENKITNIIGQLEGSTEPNYFIIIGANRNSFSSGNHSSVIGTSMLLEFTRNLAILVQREKWNPKRTILLCSWGGGDFGDVGLIEFIEEHSALLAGKTVAYVSLDDPVIGNQIMSVTTTTALEQIIYDVASKIQGADSFDHIPLIVDPTISSNKSISSGLIDPYDSLLAGCNNPYYTILGAPSIITKFKNTKSSNSDMRSMKKLDSKIEIGLFEAAARFNSLLAVALADSVVLQFNPTKSAENVKRHVLDILSDIENISDKYSKLLKKKCTSLVSYAEKLLNYLTKKADFEDTAVRNSINQHLLNFEKALSKVVVQLYRINTTFKIEEVLGLTF